LRKFDFSFLVYRFALIPERETINQKREIENGVFEMTHHLRANLWLLLLTILICSVLYPLLLLGIGQTVFRDQAQGSLVTDASGKVVGSRLIAQPFSAEEYFQPRPSSASYKADASGASNWGASNYLLRDRVARMLGPIVRYGPGAEKYGKKPGEKVGSDIEKWFQLDRFEKEALLFLSASTVGLLGSPLGQGPLLATSSLLPGRAQKESGLVAQWASLHSGLAEGWIKDTDGALKPQWKKDDKDPALGQSFLLQLAQDDPELFRGLAAALKEPASASPAELAKAFFPLFSERYPGEWLTVDEYETRDKQKRKKLARVKESSDIQAVFFDTWRQEHPAIPLEEVPADMVTASGSGLDPHITLANARYQLKYKVAAAWAKKLKADEEKVQQEILKLLNESASAPLRGLAGVPLINVLEVNLALPGRMEQLARTIK
jgi:K+-transporting ATPase ATPase C chain